MTREEAINMLYGIKADNLNLDDAYTKDKYEALKIAIEALEKQPCEDAISRSETIKYLNINMAWYNEDGEIADSDEKLKAITDLINGVPFVTPQQQPCEDEYAEEQTRWIPVSERLPEDKQAVLVWCPQYKNIYCAYLEKEQWWIFGAFVQIVPNEVIAWMPLPEPCNAESEVLS